MNSNVGVSNSPAAIGPGTRKVRIYQPHTHAGKRLQPGPDGIEIEVTEPEAKFLESAGVTKRPQAIAEVPVAATSRTARPQG